MVRKEKAEKRHEDTLELAKSLRSKNRKLSQVYLAKKMVEHWEANDISPPVQEDWLIKLIRGWEKEGLLPAAEL